MPARTLKRKTLEAAHRLVVEAMVARGQRHKVTQDLLDAPFAEADTKSLYVPICFRDANERKLYGIVLEPDSVDADGHSYEPQEIEKAAHRFLIMLKSMPVDLNHQEALPEVYPVESFIAPVDFKLGDQMVKKGSWILASYVDSPETWERLESEGIVGYSLEATGIIEEDE